MVMKLERVEVVEKIVGSMIYEMIVLEIEDGHEFVIYEMAILVIEAAHDSGRYEMVALAEFDYDLAVEQAPKLGVGFAPISSSQSFHDHSYSSPLSSSSKATKAPQSSQMAQDSTHVVDFREDIYNLPSVCCSSRIEVSSHHT